MVYTNIKKCEEISIVHELSKSKLKYLKCLPKKLSPCHKFRYFELLLHQILLV